MDEKLKLPELINTVLSKMIEMDYTAGTITNYRRFYKRFSEYVKARGYEYFSEVLGADYLREKYGCQHDTICENSPNKRICMQVRYIRVLGDYQIHGFILRRKLGPTATSKIAEALADAFIGYQESCKKRGLSETGTYSRCNRIRHFIFFMNEQGVNNYSDITTDLLSDYVKTFINYSSKSIATELVSLRCFLRYLFQNRYTDADLTEMLPRVKNYYSPAMPRTWSKENLKKIFGCIDRGNPTGKRDYAMLLMIARYGIRSVDIKNLQLGHLDWGSSVICFNQHKTGKEVQFPILKDVGWALIDYLKNGRPKAVSEFVFLRHNAPYEPFEINSAMNRILVKYIRCAGIPITPETPCGLHSLRHTLASTLLAENTPLPVISEILGHTTMKSTDIYLHIDHERLLECALNPEEVND